MNVSGIGIDAVDIGRFKKAIEEWGESFLKKIFTQREIEYGGTKKSYAMHLAGKFAAKEAVKKAIPNGAEIGLNWAQIEILNGEDGKPYACLHGRAEELMEKYNLSKIYVSISHTDKLAISNAVGVKNGA
ncbi:MAG: holo-ACP synthase [Candidatus Omnitrophota bacterium]